MADLFFKPIFFMGDVLRRMRDMVWRTSYRSGAVDQAGKPDAVEQRPGTIRAFDIIKWLGKILGAVGTFGSIIAGPVAHFMYGVDPMSALLLTATGLFISKTFLYLDDQLEEAEAVFWLIVAPLMGWTWKDILNPENNT